MFKYDSKVTIITFSTAKSNGVISVRSKNAVEYAKRLAANSSVESFEASVELLGWQDKICHTGIRRDYISAKWYSDFVIHKSDGSKAVRELVKARDLQRRSEVEKLEISRRYWKALNVSDWGVVIVDKKEDVKP